MKFTSLFHWPSVALLAALAPLQADDSASLAIPWPLRLENTAQSCRVPGPAELELTAPGKTDLFISPDGQYRIDLSPRLVFRPEGPFILSAKISPEFKAKWDAGVLVLFNDAEHFAKFCYERDYQGVPRIVSVVCNGTADDCNSMPVPEGSVYFRIVGASPGDTFEFYSSADGQAWFLLRNFRLAKTDKLRAGFSAQSPTGEGCTVRFSRIRLERRSPKDFWAGD